MSDSFVTPWIVACKAPLSMRFLGQEDQYWNGLPFLSPGDLPNPEAEPTFPSSHTLAVGFFTAEPSGKPKTNE